MPIRDSHTTQSNNASRSAASRMMSISLVLAVAFAFAGAACSNLERSRDLSNPKVRPEVTAAQVCSNCHGLDGNSESPNFPRLAGQLPAYLISQLDNFRNHHRADPEGFEYMWGISHRLTDDQIKGLAEYFGKQTAQPIVAAVSAQQMATGKAIYDAGVPAEETPPCVACHGPKGEGQASFPRLAWQHQDYLVKQLKVFRGAEGKTEGRPGTPMKQVTHLLSNQEMKDVAAYLQAFPSDK
jgi:cytochrome c553